MDIYIYIYIYIYCRQVPTVSKQMNPCAFERAHSHLHSRMNPHAHTLGRSLAHSLARSSPSAPAHIRALARALARTHAHAIARSRTHTLATRHMSIGLFGRATCVQDEDGDEGRTEEGVDRSQQLVVAHLRRNASLPTFRQRGGCDTYMCLLSE